MNREVHVRFCGNVGVKLPCVTRLYAELKLQMKEYPADVIRPKSVGYWKSNTDPDFPEPHEFIDLSISVEQRQALFQYLENGLKYFSYLGHSYCRFNCGVPDWEMGCSDVTDGTYAWPEGLSHYLKWHGVWLPIEFVVHAMNNLNFDKAAIDRGKLGFRDDSWWKSLTSLH